MLDIIIENWKILLPSTVGLVALMVFYLQEKQKKKEAASLIILQINELSERMREISGYLSNGNIDVIGIYESLPIIEDNYWNKYKHYFINNIDADSFSSINQFYRYILEIKEQQEFCKALQKTSLFLTQQSVHNLEFEFLRNGIYNNYGKINLEELMSSLNKTMPKNMTETEKNPLIDFTKLLLQQQPGFDLSQFWYAYNKQKEKIQEIFNSKSVIFTNYTPVQVAVTLEKILKKCSMLTVVGCPGYQRLNKIATARAWLLYIF